MQAGPAISRHQPGMQLRQLRKAHSLRPETAAVKLGVAPSTLSRIETGQAPTKISYRQLDKALTWPDATLEVVGATGIEPPAPRL
jgi:transcriptional regulator with XRE-family HTH domain